MFHCLATTRYIDNNKEENRTLEKREDAQANDKRIPKIKHRTGSSLASKQSETQLAVREYERDSHWEM